MNATALAYALQLMTALPGLVQAGKDIKDIVAKGAARIEAMQAEGREPTAAEWKELQDDIDPKRAELHGR